MRSVLQLYRKKKTMSWYFLYHEISCLLITRKFLFWIFWRWKIWYFWAKKLMEIYSLVTEKFLFWPFGQWEIRSFLSQKDDGKMIFTGHWKVLVLTISEMGNTVVFEPKRWWKDDIYWLLKISSFHQFGNGKYGLFWAKRMMERWYLLITEKFLFWMFRWWEIRSFFSQKIDGKVIFPWSFLAFHDIPGLGKYGFSRSDSVKINESKERFRVIFCCF